MNSAIEHEASTNVHQRAPVRLDTALLCAAIVASPQLFGGAFPWSVVAIAGLGLLALGASTWVRRRSASPVVDRVLVMMLFAWLWTCIQAVPLPPRLASALGLASVESAERLQGLAWSAEIPLTISYDPGSTQLQILIGVAIIASFLAARFVGPGGLPPLAMATVVSAGLIGVEGLVHRAIGLEAVFGVYTPRFTLPQLLTPLMNNNHIGGTMSLGALVAAGLAASGNGRSRAGWAMASGFCALIVALTLSRGAIGSLLFGFMAIGAWVFSRSRHGRRRAAIGVGLFGAAVAGALVFAGLEPILRRFETQGFDKLAVAARGLRLLEGPALWLGIGRGAFSSTFVAEEGSLGRYTHPENILVQWTTEWGVVVALALFTVLAIALWMRLRATEDPLVASTCIAVVALVLQNLVDFSLEMAGIAVVVASLLGAVLPVAHSKSSKGEWRLVTAVFVVFAALFAALGPRVSTGDTQTIVDQLTRAIAADREQEFRATLGRGLALHPAEPAFALLAATYAGTKGHHDAPKWLHIVMQEAPGWSAPHVVAAQWLLARGQLDQALLEIREAERRHPGSATTELCTALGRSPTMEHLDRAAPEAPLRTAYLDRATTCPGLPPELRAKIDAAILELEPARATTVLRQARRLASEGRVAEARSMMKQALEQDPTNIDLWVAIMQEYLRAGDAEGAESLLRAAKAKGLEGRALVETQARIEAAQNQVDEMRITLTRLRGQARGDATLIARAFLLEGQLEADLGHVDEALAAYGAADLVQPQTPALEYAAQLALQSGRRSYALGLYKTLCSRKPGGSACERETQLSRELRKAPRNQPLP